MDQESHLHSGDDGELSVSTGRALLRLQDAVAMALSHAFQRLVQGFVVFSFQLLLLWLAAFLYGSFYYSYMPKAGFSTPVHYYYRTDCESSASFMCPHPVANISLMKNKKHVLTLGQVYQISLQLEMPESPTNQELGMFMIKTTCFSQAGGQIASSARSARQMLPASSSRFVSTVLMHNNLLIKQLGQSQIRAAYAYAEELRCNRGRAQLNEMTGRMDDISMLRYRSELLRTLRTVLLLPAFLTGVTEQKQVLEVELFSDYKDDPYTPSATVIIEILSNKVQIYSSQLFVHAHYTGIRYLLFHFPVSSALVGIFSNFISLSVLFIYSYMRLPLRVEREPEQLRTDGMVSEREMNMINNQQDGDKDSAAGTTELLGSLQITPTNLSWEKPHMQFGTSTELPNRNILGQVEINQSAA